MKYKKLKRMYYNLFKAKRDFLIACGIKYPSKNCYSFKFLKRKAFAKVIKSEEYSIDVI